MCQINATSDPRLDAEPATDVRSFAGGSLTIDLAALAENWRRLRTRSQGAECAAAVKADAYGIGLEPAARALYRAGCRSFFVAHLTEAEELRHVLPDATIYGLNGLPAGAARRFAEFGIRPVLGCPEDVAEWAAFCRGAGTALPAAIHVDTGLNRLGLSMRQVQTLRDDGALAGFEPALLMSHFVASEDPADRTTDRQIAAFADARRLLPDLPASLANSSGIFLPDAPLLDLVRPGYALYGGNPTPGRPNPMRPVVRLEARIVQTREVECGDTVGYGGLWTAPGPRRLATLSVGYADGIPRAASGTDRAAGLDIAAGAALVGGRLCPFAGRVSMDLIVIDVTEVPAGEAGRDAPAVLIGNELDVDAVGRRAGTIGYEILTGLGRRFRRTYLGG